MKSVFVAVWIVAITIFVGCGDEKIDKNMFSDGNKISKEQLEKMQNLDVGGYKGLENVFSNNISIKSEGKPVVLVFGKNNCSWCERLKDDIKSSKELQQKMINSFASYYVNISYSKIHKIDFNGKTKETSTIDLASEYSVRSTPTVVFLDSDGNTILIYPGYLPDSTLMAILNFISGGEYKKYKTQKEIFEAISKVMNK